MVDRVSHPWPPVFDSDSRVLILGTMPSPKSRAIGFYYAHPGNLFWRTLATILDRPEPSRDRTARRAFLLDNHIALWDVLQSCAIEGANDASITAPRPNLFRPIIEQSKIDAVFTTGKKATELFDQLCFKEAGMRAIYLPSTSPANRAQQARPEYWTAWDQVRDALDNPH